MPSATARPVVPGSYSRTELSGKVSSIIGYLLLTPADKAGKLFKGNGTGRAYGIQTNPATFSEAFPLKWNPALP
jgi:hypothetical protein